jgi:hypothetical protein
MGAAKETCHPESMEPIEGRPLPGRARQSSRGHHLFTTLAAPILAMVTWATAQADWMNLTGAESAANIAEIVVLDDRVRVRLEVYVGDLELFADLIPDDLLTSGGAGRPSEADRMAHFASNVLSIRADGGEPLPAILKLAEPRLRVDRKSPFAGMINPQTRQRAPEPPSDKRVLYAEIDYPFREGPDTLTISPPLDANARSAVNIGFIAYHKAVPVIDFRYLSADATLRLNWDDPWYSRFDNPNLKRHHKNALMSFLYIEPREVRHEVLTRVADLRRWVDLEYDGGMDGIIGPEEQAAIKNVARDFFETHNLLRINGEARSPASSRAEFLNISINGVTVLDEKDPIDFSTAVIGLILHYPIRQIPQEVTVDWELFDARNERVPTTAIDPVGPLSTFVDAANPVIEWRNFLRKYVEPQVEAVRIDADDTLRIPILSLLLLIGSLLATVLAIRRRHTARAFLGVVALLLVAAAVPASRWLSVAIHNPFAGPPTAMQSAEIVEALLENVNAAYIEKQDARLADALSIVVADDGAKEVTAELDRALAIRVAGGGVARTTSIEDLTVEEIVPLDGRDGFRTLASWTAHASAGHWGHVHLRRIHFRALMELTRIDGTWKIAGLTVVDAQPESRPS